MTNPGKGVRSAAILAHLKQRAKGIRVPDSHVLEWMSANRELIMDALNTPSDWVFELVSAAQRFICETSDMDLARAPEAARRFSLSFSKPPNFASRVLMRAMLIEISSRWEYACHSALGVRCHTPHDAPANLGLRRSRSGAWEKPDEQNTTEREIFITWMDAFCAEMRRTHPEDLALRVAAVITANLERPLRVGEIASKVGAHPATVRRAFDRKFGMSLREFHLRARVERAELLLGSTPRPKVEPVALELGWRGKKDLYRAIRRIRGCTPGTLRRN
jgi:AraC-like DNA-binding protein